MSKIAVILVCACLWWLVLQIVTVSFLNDMSIHFWKTLLLVSGTITGLMAIVTAFAYYRIYRLESIQREEAARKSALSGVLSPPKGIAREDTATAATSEPFGEISGKYKTSDEIYKIYSDRTIKRTSEERGKLWQEFLALKNRELTSGNMVKISFGSNILAISREELAAGQDLRPLNIGGEVPMIIRVRNDVLLFTGSFRSLDGIIAEIVDNEWEINPNNYFKRNYDEHGLEVIDADGIMKFQVDYMDRNNILVNGFFKIGSRIWLVTPETWGSWPERHFKGKSDLIKESEKLPPMFLYPADRHFGQRVRE